MGNFVIGSYRGYKKLNGENERVNKEDYYNYLMDMYIDIFGFETFISLSGYNDKPWCFILSYVDELAELIDEAKMKGVDVGKIPVFHDVLSYIRDYDTARIEEGEKVGSRIVHRVRKFDRLRESCNGLSERAIEPEKKIDTPDDFVRSTENFTLQTYNLYVKKEEEEFETYQTEFELLSDLHETNFRNVYMYIVACRILGSSNISKIKDKSFLIVVLENYVECFKYGHWCNIIHDTKRDIYRMKMKSKIPKDIRKHM